MRTTISVLYLTHQIGRIKSILDMAMSKEKFDNPKSGMVEIESEKQQTICRQRRRRGAHPEPGSLYAIMREHSGLSLYVLPICWTDLHTRLLNTRFIQLDPILSPVPNPTPDYEWRPSPTANTLCHELDILLDSDCNRPFLKTRAIKNVMATFYPETMSNAKTYAEFSICFGGRAFPKAVRVPVLWKPSADSSSSFDSAATWPASSFGRPSSGAQESGRSSQTTSQPMVGYVNRQLLASLRRNLYRVVPGPESGDRQNTPVTNLQRLRSNMLRPANIDEDAHFVGLIIAMAQSMFYPDGKARASSQSCSRSGRSLTIEESRPVFHDVTVRLLAIDEDNCDFIVYNAAVSAAFLRRFAYPAQAPATPSGATLGDAASAQLRSDGGLDITYTKVPIWPVLGLKERLGKALGRDIAGVTAQLGQDKTEIMEMWESPCDREGRFNSRKRRRDERNTLLEVLNSSFEVDDDDVDNVFDIHKLGSGAIGSDDSPAFSPRAKRRCSRAMPSLEVC